MTELPSNVVSSTLTMASATTRLQSALIEALGDLEDGVGGTIAEDELVTQVGVSSFVHLVEASDLDGSDQRFAYSELCDLLASRLERGFDEVMGCSSASLRTTQIPLTSVQQTFSTNSTPDIAQPRSAHRCNEKRSRLSLARPSDRQSSGHASQHVRLQPDPGRRPQPRSTATQYDPEFMRRFPLNISLMAVAIVVISSACNASDANDVTPSSARTPSASEAPLGSDAPSVSDTPSNGGDEAQASDAPRAGDAPSGSDAPQTTDVPLDGAQGEQQSSGPDKVTICHRTNGSKEWVEITISESAVNAHLNHPWGSDIIPAPPEGCPAPPVPTTTPPVPTTTPPVPTTTPPVPTTTPAEILPPTTAPPSGPTTALPSEPTTTPPDAPSPEISDPSEGIPPLTNQSPGSQAPDELPPTGGNWTLALLALGMVTLGAGAVRLSRR
jgi:hypothetical protein